MECLQYFVDVLDITKDTPKVLNLVISGMPSILVMRSIGVIGGIAF